MSKKDKTKIDEPLAIQPEEMRSEISRQYVEFELQEMNKYKKLVAKIQEKFVKAQRTAKTNYTTALNTAKAEYEAALRKVWKQETSKTRGNKKCVNDIHG